MKVASDDQMQDLLARADDANSPTAAIEKVETVQGLLKQVSQLKTRQQEVLRLKFHGGLSYQEIAEVTGLTRSHVGVILHTAISALRQTVTP